MTEDILSREEVNKLVSDVMVLKKENHELNEKNLNLSNEINVIQHELVLIRQAIDVCLEVIEG